MPCTLLVAREDEVEVGRIVDGVEHGEDRTARVSEHLLDPMAEHHLVEDLASGETDEGVVEGCIGGGART